MVPAAEADTQSLRLPPPVDAAQRKWSYLEPLFIGSDEVRRELPEDAKRFEGLDASVKTFLKEMHATSNVKAACNKAGLVAQLEAALKGLDRIFNRTGRYRELLEVL